MEWQRPDCIPYPKVWHKFEGIHEINNKKPQFWIQDIPEDLPESVLQTMKAGFVNEEPLCKFSNLSEDLVSLEEASLVYKYIITEKLSCVCMTNDGNGQPKPVATSILTRISIDDPPFYITIMEWQRPDCIPYPKVWHKFEGIHEINNKKPQFWIQDIPEDLSESVLQTMKTGFVNEEPLCKFSKLSEDLVSLEEASLVYKYIITEKLSCVCMTNDDNGQPKPVAISILTRISIDDPPFYPETKTYSRLYNIQQYAYDFKSIFKHLNITEYLSDRGIYVLPEFRKQGICYEILKCWSIIGKAMGFKVAAGTFTSINSQGAARRAGFIELSSFEYVKLKEINPLFYLPGIEEHSKYLKIMYKTF